MATISSLFDPRLRDPLTKIILPSLNVTELLQCRVCKALKEEAEKPIYWQRFARDIGIPFSSTDGYKTIKKEIKVINREAKIYELTGADLSSSSMVSVAKTKKFKEKLDLIKARDTIKVWRNIQAQARPKDGFTLTYPDFDELEKLEDKTALVRAFDQWIDENKDKMILQELIISFTNLEFLPKSIGNLTSLTHLHLNNNNLKELPKEIGNLTSLTKLGLNGNNLKELPKELANLTSLTYLNLTNNNLKELPKEIGNLTSLTKLGLNGNNLKELPKELANLTSLTYLNLTNNNLKELPKEIGNLTSLIELGLWGNNLKELPKELANLSVLKYLSIRGNKIRYYPYCLGILQANGTRIVADEMSMLVHHFVRRASYISELFYTYVLGW